ncbi:hypothetical protein HPB49_010689 [Dermacentor silvarum]|uniref:Uncharacterized protein n=1 Tax=Dermacentor silvarum TaxID=543639 RepID=A0ACB8CWM9_DERSI|nr:hypothetical protein HPB49_010689 [Dermacentor silvarum]
MTSLLSAHVDVRAGHGADFVGGDVVVRGCVYVLSLSFRGKRREHEGAVLGYEVSAVACGGVFLWPSQRISPPLAFENSSRSGGSRVNRVPRRDGMEPVYPTGRLRVSARRCGLPG